MITMPFIYVNRINGKISSAENRYLASFPKLFDETNGKINKGFVSGFNTWLSDNIGFRDLFLKLNEAIDVSIFHQIGNNSVVIGKDNWLFLMQDWVLADVQHTNSINEKDIEYYKKRYSEITSYFKNIGTNFIITVFPHKSTMYSEYLPKTIVPINSKSLLDIFKNDFQNNANFDLSVPFNKLKEAKESRLIYSKAYDQSHWNNYGAFIGYTELMKQAQKYIPNLKILTENDFNIIAVETKTNLGGSLFTTETDYDFKLKLPATAVSDKSFFQKIYFKSEDPWRSYNYYKNNDSTLPKAIVVGDSYVWMFMLDKMAESFSQLVFIHQLDIGNLNAIYSRVKPDIVIAAGLNTTMLGIANYLPPLDIKNLYADIVSNDTPREIKRGEKYKVNITVKNITGEAWSKKRNIRLCIWQDGQDRGYRLDFPDGFELKPNEEYTFTLNDFQAPPGSSIYIEYQMVEEGRTYFGEKERVDIKVKD
jgi:alginate O-acetyltransferase complex protein AlgJ